MGVFSENVGWLAFFVSRPPSGVEKDEKCAKRRATIRYGVVPGRREARVPVVETVHEMLLLRDWVQGVSATTAASKRARRCSASAARCAKKRRLASGDTRVSHLGCRTCGWPILFIVARPLLRRSEGKGKGNNHSKRTAAVLVIIFLF